MNAKYLLAIIAFSGLQACNTSQDLLMRSSSRLPLPLGTVHVPAHDSGMLLQGSLTVHKLPEKSSPIVMSLQNGLLQSDNGNTSQILGPSYITTPPIQIAASGSIFLSDHFRFGLGLDGTMEQAATWLEVGLRFGHDVSVEGFWALGSTPVHSNAQWKIKTYDPQGSSLLGYTNDTIVTQQTIDTSARQSFYRIGLHVARRQGGPWAELQMASIDLLPTSPTANDQWGTDLTILGVGWSEPTPLGTATGYFRGVFSHGDMIPVFGLQWTGELKVGN